MKRLLNVTEVYRIDSEEEVNAAIQEEKEKAFSGGYTLKGYSSKLKEKKSKGEVVDLGFELIIKKELDSFWE